MFALPAVKQGPLHHDSRRTLHLPMSATATPLDVQCRGSRRMCGQMRRCPILSPGSASAVALRCCTSTTGDSPNHKVEHSALCTPCQHRLGTICCAPFLIGGHLTRKCNACRHVEDIIGKPATWSAVVRAEGTLATFSRPAAHDTGHTSIISHGTYAPAACKGAELTSSCTVCRCPGSWCWR